MGSRRLRLVLCLAQVTYQSFFQAQAINLVALLGDLALQALPHAIMLLARLGEKRLVLHQLCLHHPEPRRVLVTPLARLID